MHETEGNGEVFPAVSGPSAWDTTITSIALGQKSHINELSVKFKYS